MRRPAVPDYRVLQPAVVTDPNGNRTAARFDALGMLAGTAVLGKATGPSRAIPSTTSRLISRPRKSRSFSTSPTRARSPSPISGTATTRILYDLERVPVCAASIARETHVSDLAPGQQTKVQLHFVYSDGFGREAQTKVQAEPGPLDLERSQFADRQSPLGRHGRKSLQQQGQADPAIRAVLQRDAAIRHREHGASAARCSMTRSSASSRRCIPTTRSRRSSSIPGSRRATTSTTP